MILWSKLKEIITILLIPIKSPLLVSITLGSFLTDPKAIIPNWGWLIIAVPVKLSKTPMLVIVNVPSLTSSGFKSFDLAF